MSRILSVLAVVAAAFVVAGCGGDDETIEGAEDGGVLGETSPEAIVDDPVVFELAPDDAGPAATVRMMPAEDGNELETSFHITLDDESFDAPTAYLYRGDCASLEPSEGALDTIGELSDGVLETGTVSLSMLELLDGEFAVAIHDDTREQSMPVVCGNVPEKEDVDVSAE